MWCPRAHSEEVSKGEKTALQIGLSQRLDHGGSVGLLSQLDKAHNESGEESKTLKPGGHLIIGTFAPEAPPECSRLRVQRYNPVLLENRPDGEFELKRHHNELHITPGGVEQMYLYYLFLP
jgi:hypothetical protein